MSELLLEAILSDDVSLLCSLLSEHVCSVNEILHNGSTPLNVAIANGYLDIARALIDYGSDVNLPDSFRVDGCRRRPIHYAAACGDSALSLVRLLVEEFAVDVDERDYSASTPLHHAAGSGNIDIVEYLVSAGCDIDSRSNSGRTALWKAAQSGHREIVHLLYALGADVNVRNQVGETVLFECARRSDLTEILGDLVAQLGGDVHVVDIERTSALHNAACSGHAEGVRLLMAAGADAAARNECGNTVLHNAAMHGHADCVVVLLNRVKGDVLVSWRNVSGQSALYTALLHTQRDCVWLLYRVFGARLTARETDMFEQYEARRNGVKWAFYDWFYCDVQRRAPTELATLCRQTIRRHLVHPPCAAATKLPLPPSLHRFILLDELQSSAL